MSSYAELHVSSNFSFLRGASHPDELVLSAAALGHAAVALTDRATLAGVVRAHRAAKDAGIRFVVGCRIDLVDGPGVLCYPTDRDAYGRLSRLLTRGKRRAVKGQCLLTLQDLLEHAQGLLLALLPSDREGFRRALRETHGAFPGAIFLAASNTLFGDDEQKLDALAQLGHRMGVPLLATNDVHAHAAGRRPLQDVLSCIREHRTLAQAGHLLFANGERHLKSPREMASLFRRHPDAIARTLEVVERCRFSLDELRYHYPTDPVPEGRLPQQELERLAWKGAGRRYPAGLPDKVARQISHELALIAELEFAPYFLTVHDIVRFARSQGILCQGRGSAANSAVCFCLGITSVDPDRIDVLFERFVSAARGEPPDIDVDFEHERREDVIQYVYAKYGRDRAGMTGTIITYRTKSAIREVGKVFGLSEDAIVALQGAAWRRPADEVEDGAIREAGLDPADPTVRRVMSLAAELRGFPRHLSQHTGGMVITNGPLDELVPIANAAMEGRTVIEWDKNDLDALGILKIDILGLGMLTCVRKAFELIRHHHGRNLSLATVPAEDPAVYRMLSRADSVGVFQVESRAQMSMLPRLRPRCFYDLVIQVAIVRPGPIQGGMVHPYLRRRQGRESVSYPSSELEQVLGNTLGVPLFQEQAMKIAIVAAGFTPAEADRLRRAMASFRHTGEIHVFRDKFIDGMTARGYRQDFAQRCFQQIEGFADYGFPESHAASFALLVYVSAWLKCHYPAAFACALLDSQPMGFYGPAQIVRDARAHGVEVRPVDVAFSQWECTLEGSGNSREVALRLGLSLVRGLSRKEVAAIADQGGERWRLSARTIEALAAADAFGSEGLGRREALWKARGMEETPLPLFAAADRRETAVFLPATPVGEDVVEDYRAVGLSLRAHPVGLVREALHREEFQPCRVVAEVLHGRLIRVAGLPITRQQPGSAKGVIFVTLEDETATVNLIVWPKVFETHRQPVLQARLLGVEGTVQREGDVIHVLARRLYDLSGLLRLLDGAGRLAQESRDFR